MRKVLLILMPWLLLSSPSLASEILQPCPPRPRNQSAQDIQRAVEAVPRTAKAVIEVGGVRAKIPVSFLGFHPQPWQIGCVRTLEAFNFAFWQPSQTALALPDLPLYEKSDAEGEDFIVQVILMAPAPRERLGEIYRTVFENSEHRVAPVEGPNGLKIYPGPISTLLYEDEELVFYGECTDTYCTADTHLSDFELHMLFAKEGLPYWKESARAAVDLLNNWRKRAD
jgi:hypothetical protein